MCVKDCLIEIEIEMEMEIEMEIETEMETETEMERQKKETETSVAILAQDPCCPLSVACFALAGSTDGVGFAGAGFDDAAGRGGEEGES